MPTETPDLLQLQANSGLRTGSRQIILLVDDSPDNLRVLSAALAQQHYDIRCATSGTMALQAINSEQPDLILLDIQMPGLNGYQVCQRLKANIKTRQVPVIFISALDQTLDKVKAFEVGGVDYIPKPFQIEEVLARVRTQLDLKAAKMQIAQSEKMVGLGHLAAGIAHEINNPVNFIQANLEYVSDYVEELLSIVTLYRQQFPDPPAPLKEAIEQTELEYLSQDLKKVLTSMQTGTDRITEIIHALRNYSRLGESDCKPADLHAGILSTLVLLGSRLKDCKTEISIVKDFGELPPVECFSGLVDQVFMNLIANAIDAIESAIPTDNDSPTGHIVITTRQLSSDWVEVSIQDSGPGIAEASQPSLFEPFFTTKPAGQGTGMGLALSQRIIVEKHGGKLLCHSNVGQGTTFTIQLPTTLSKR